MQHSQIYFKLKHWVCLDSFMAVARVAYCCFLSLNFSLHSTSNYQYQNDTTANSLKLKRVQGEFVFGRAVYNVYNNLEWNSSLCG